MDKVLFEFTGIADRLFSSGEMRDQRTVVEENVGQDRQIGEDQNWCQPQQHDRKTVVQPDHRQRQGDADIEIDADLPAPVKPVDLCHLAEKVFPDGAVERIGEEGEKQHGDDIFSAGQRTGIADMAGEIRGRRRSHQESGIEEPEKIAFQEA